MRGEDSECISIRGEGASGQIRVERIRAAREAIQHSALSADARGRVMFLYGAQDMNQSSANALLKIIEEPPEGVLFLFTAASAAGVLPTIRSRCAAYTIAPVPGPECAAALRRRLPRLTRDQADDLAFLYEGHIGLGLAAADQPDVREALARAREFAALAAQGDAYRALALVTKLERDKTAAAALLEQLAFVCSAALRRPGYAGLEAKRAALLLRACGAARGRFAGQRKPAPDAGGVRRPVLRSRVTPAPAAPAANPKQIRNNHESHLCQIQRKRPVLLF